MIASRNVLPALLLAATTSFAAEGPCWRVVLPETPKPWEVTAAAELEEYVARRLDGGVFAIDGLADPVLHVGDSSFARAKGLTSDKIENERWLVKSFGRDVVINGGGSRGALYATYHFLEDFMDVRWWSETEVDVLKKGSLTLGKLDVTDKPRFFYRDIFRSLDAGRTSSRLAIRRRLNRNGDVRVPIALGGAFSYGSPAHAHTFDMYIPWAKYGKDHPEWFSVVDDKRFGGGGFDVGGQLCFANVAGFRQLFLDQMLKNIDADARKARAAGLPPPEFYEISMNDNKKYCECEKCAELAKKYGQSGVYLMFVNDMAREIAKVHPNVFVTMLAYYFTEEVPLGGVRPADNVIVKLCNTRANLAASILHPDNHEMRELTEAWQPIAKNVFIWDYDITYTKDTAGYPFPSELYYADKYRFYLEHGVTGIFWEHEEPDLSDFYDLKYYLKTKLFEDPYCDYEKLLANSFNEFFGPQAGPHVLAARRRLAEAQARNRGFVTWFPQFCRFTYIDESDVAFILDEFAVAEKTANETHLRRLRRAKMGLRRFAERRAPMVNRQGPDAVRPAQLPPDPAFAGQSHWDFYAKNFTIFNRTGNDVRLVDEPGAALGQAVKVAFDGDRFKMPFLVAFYDTEKNLSANECNITAGQAVPNAWHWYPCGTFKASAHGFVYMTTQWALEIPLPLPAFAGKAYQLSLHAKFVNDGVLIDRAVLIDQKE